MSWRCLMVDVDGVIVRGRADGRRWDADLQKDLGLDPKILQSHFFQPHWPSIILGHADLYDRLRPVLNEVAPNLSAETFVAYWFKQDSALDTQLLADLAARRAEGAAMHLATVQEHHRARYLWEDLGLKARFDAIHYSADYGAAKPDTAFFQAVAARTGYAPADLMLIDDSEANVAGAQAAGWQARHWTGAQTLSQLLAS